MDIRYDLVIRIADSTFGETISRNDLTFAATPCVDDMVSWNNDWTLFRVTHRYIGSDWIELGLGSIASREVDSFLEAGWKKT